MTRRATTKIGIAAAGVVAGIVAAAVVILPSALAGPTVHYSQDIYKITYRGQTADGKSGSVSEWVALNTGRWRVDADDQSFISSPSSYVVLDRDNGSIYRRTGSAKFMGDLHDAPDGALAVRAYLKGDTTLAGRGIKVRATTKAGKTQLTGTDSSGRQRFVVTVDQHISDEDAAAAKLLDTAPVQPNMTDVELPVGKAASGLTGFWLGQDAAGVHAATAAEHVSSRTAAQVRAGLSANGDVQSQVTIYEKPGVQVSSAQPGVKTQPAGELQVSSEPLLSAHAQSLTAAMDGRNGDATYAAWPRTTITLADGEKAVLIPSQFDGDGNSRSGFFVIVGDTLVSVSGNLTETDIPTLAQTLRPLGK